MAGLLVLNDLYFLFSFLSFISFLPIHLFLLSSFVPPFLAAFLVNDANNVYFLCHQYFFISTYVYIYIYIYMCVCVYVRTCMHACMHPSIHPSIMHMLCIHIHVHTDTYYIPFPSSSQDAEGMSMQGSSGKITSATILIVIYNVFLVEGHTTTKHEKWVLSLMRKLSLTHKRNPNP